LAGRKRTRAGGKSLRGLQKIKGKSEGKIAQKEKARARGSKKREFWRKKGVYENSD